MRLVVSEAAAAAIHAQGGRLYVWPTKNRCCGGGVTLAAATSAPAQRNFRREQGSTSFELYLPTHLAELPEELHIEARGRSGKIQAYWNGLAWVV